MKNISQEALAREATKLLNDLPTENDLTNCLPDYCEATPLFSRAVDLTKTTPTTNPKNYEERNDHGFHSRTYHGNYEPTSPDYETEASRKSVVRLTAHVYDYETNGYFRQVVDPVVKNHRVEEFHPLTVATLLTHPKQPTQEDEPTQETNGLTIPPLEWNGVYDPAPSNECHLVHSRPTGFVLATFKETEQPADPYYEALAMAQRRSEDLARETKAREKKRLALRPTSTTVGKKPKPPKYPKRATPKPPSMA